jgi:hypothetical protein
MTPHIYSEVTAKVDAAFLQCLPLNVDGDSSSVIVDVLRSAGLQRIRPKTRHSTTTWVLYGTLDSINAAYSLLSTIYLRSQTSSDASVTNGCANNTQVTAKSLHVDSAKTPLQPDTDCGRSLEVSGRISHDNRENGSRIISSSPAVEKVSADVPASAASEEVAVPASFEADFADCIPHFEFYNNDFAVGFQDLDYGDLLTPPHYGGYNIGQVDPKQKRSDLNHVTPNTNGMSSPIYHFNGSLNGSPRGAGRRKLTPRRCKLVAADVNSSNEDFQATWTTDEIAAAREMIGM